MEVIYFRQEDKDPVTGIYGIKSNQQIKANVSVNSTDTQIYAFSDSTTSITTNKVFLSNSDSSDHTVQFGYKDQASGTINYILTVTVPASATNQEFPLLEGIDLGGDLYMKADADGFITTTVFLTSRFISA